MDIIEAGGVTIGHWGLGGATAGIGIAHRRIESVVIDIAAIAGIRIIAQNYSLIC
ncbi:MAG: hypothetical protein KGQ83_02395 [Planctomycetes bacterium]|nr:hypothetical protein [Planctomycetota bacterium]